MRTSQRGAAFIAAEEGLVPAVYRDAVGVLTWGIGHTRSAGDPDPHSMSPGMPSNVDAVIKEAMRVFDEDLKKYEREVIDAFGPNLKQHELDGLVSWHFNTGGAHSSSSVGKWKAGDKKGAVATIKKWNKGTINGKKRVLNVLVGRRKLEADMILNGEYPPPTLLETPVWGVKGKTFRVQWGHVITRIPYDQMLAGRRPVGGDAAVGAFTIFSALAVGVAVFWDKVSNFIGGLF